MNIVCKLPCIVELREDGAARYFCEQCKQETDWTQRATEPGQIVAHACEPNFILEMIPIRVIGPEIVDGIEQVKFYCDVCQNWTGWLLPPTNPGQMALHDCRPADGIAPCASNLISKAEKELRDAMGKVTQTAPELAHFIDQELLQKFPQARRLAAIEQLRQRDHEDRIL